MPVDSFKYLPRLIGVIYENTEVENELPIPWTPVDLPIGESKFGLVTSGGFYHKGMEPPFDLEREKQEPTWGDPGYRTIPRNIRQEEIGISHLHINNEPAYMDFNILLPIHRFQELEDIGHIGSLAEKHYSFMGFQGYPPDTTAWREIYAPEIAEKLVAERVNCVLLTPSWPDCTINVPVLARVLEESGLSTVVVTTMPHWAEMIGTPRTLGVEFPFAHTLGQPGNRDQQMRIILQALDVLEKADTPGTIVHSDERWPESEKEAIKTWQPPAPSPIVSVMGPHVRKLLRERRRKG